MVCVVCVVCVCVCVVCVVCGPSGFRPGARHRGAPGSGGGLAFAAPRSGFGLVGWEWRGDCGQVAGVVGVMGC